LAVECQLTTLHDERLLDLFDLDTTLDVRSGPGAVALPAKLARVDVDPEARRPLSGLL
jgi:hypothetical protein